MKRIHFLALSFLLAACSSNSSDNTTSKATVDGKKVYQQNCTVCHGADGQLGLNGAFNLTTSTISRDMALEVITHGRNAMAPYEKLLSKAEIEAVTDYILTLRQP